VKVLLCPIGSHGDVHPFVALGVELARRGHEVNVIVNGHFRPLVERVGLGYVEMGTSEEYLTALADPDVWHPVRGFELLIHHLLLKTLRQQYALLAERYVPGETVAVHSPIGFGARIAREKLGVPLATVHVSPVGLRSAYQPPVLPLPILPRWAPRFYCSLVFWLIDRLRIDPLMAGPVNGFRAELGLPPVRRFMHLWWSSPDLVLGLFPDWFGPPQPDWPPATRLTGFPLYDERGHAELPSGLSEFLAAGEPPLVFTPGSANRHGRAFFTAALEASERLCRRALLLTGFPDQLPPLPDWARSFRYVPFSEVFQRAAAVVHHGGIGTTAQALAAGVPQLVMPFSYDQPDNAARVARLGVGDVLPAKRFTARRAEAKLAGLLRPEVKARCVEVAGRCNGPDVIGRACDLIEGLA
jgi:UDP:flavonoid glycosyltransferase YjiC (YdhE family)